MHGDQELFPPWAIFFLPGRISSLAKTGQIVASRLTAGHNRASYQIPKGQQFHMKVITQLIRHFWQRAALTAEEIDYLVRHGFVRQRDLPGYHASASNMAQQEVPSLLFSEPIGPPDALEQYEEQLVRRSSRGQKAKPSRGKVLEAKDLCQRVKRELRRRSKAMSTLVELADRLQPCDQWQEAAIVLRRAAQKRFDKVLASTLRSSESSLRGVWRAVDIEPFHQLIEDAEVRGPSAQAFVALLVARNRASLGKYGWLLKYDEMQTVINLRVVHRQLLMALNRLYRHDVRLLTRTLDAGCDAVPFWALVLLHNANRLASARSGSRVREYGLDWLPHEEIWQNAWTEALVMDRRRVTSLLVEFYRDQRDLRRRPQSDYQLQCPAGWHVPDD